MALLKQPFRLASFTWPPTAGQWKALSDMIDDIYQRLKEGVSGLGTLVFTALATGFSIVGGTTTEATLTVTGDATLSGTNTGDQTITLTGDVTGSGTGSFATTLANIPAISGANLTNLDASDLASGIIPDARMPNLTGDVTTVEGAVATTLATVNANVGTFGSASAIPTFAVNAKGVITAASETAISVTAIADVAARIAMRF